MAIKTLIVAALSLLSTMIMGGDSPTVRDIAHANVNGLAVHPREAAVVQLDGPLPAFTIAGLGPSTEIESDAPAAWLIGLADGDSLLASGLATVTVSGAGWSVTIGSSGGTDIDLDGVAGTDADLEQFFRCLADGCGSADFNNDGDVGTEADIAAFFAALSGARR